MLAAAATLATHSRLLFAHLRGYAELAQAESELAAQQWMARAVWALAGLGSAIVALTLGGVALMLAATTAPAAAGVFVLWAVPAVPALIAVVAAVRLRRASPPAFGVLRGQMARDMQLISGDDDDDERTRDGRKTS
jgi:hypothetical protein